MDRRIYILPPFPGIILFCAIKEHYKRKYVIAKSVVSASFFLSSFGLHLMSLFPVIKSSPVFSLGETNLGVFVGYTPRPKCIQNVRFPALLEVP